MKNAIDFLFAQWHHKPAGILSFGLAGGLRAAEHLRAAPLDVQAVPVSSPIALSVFDDSPTPTSPLLASAVGSPGGRSDLRAADPGVSGTADRPAR